MKLIRGVLSNTMTLSWSTFVTAMIRANTNSYCTMAFTSAHPWCVHAIGQCDTVQQRYYYCYHEDLVQVILLLYYNGIAEVCWRGPSCARAASALGLRRRSPGKKRLEGERYGLRRNGGDEKVDNIILKCFREVTNVRHWSNYNGIVMEGRKTDCFLCGLCGRSWSLYY